MEGRGGCARASQLPAHAEPGEPDLLGLVCQEFPAVSLSGLPVGRCGLTGTDGRARGIFSLVLELSVPSPHITSPVLGDGGGRRAGNVFLNTATLTLGPSG